MNLLGVHQTESSKVRKMAVTGQTRPAAAVHSKVVKLTPIVPLGGKAVSWVRLPLTAGFSLSSIFASDICVKML